MKLENKYLSILMPTIVGGTLGKSLYGIVYNNDNPMIILYLYGLIFSLMFLIIYLLGTLKENICNLLPSKVLFFGLSCTVYFFNGPYQIIPFIPIISITIYYSWLLHKKDIYKSILE